MFVDAVWGHFVVFAVGQALAWWYARRGRFWFGAAVTVLIWGAIDWWLVGRYLLGLTPEQQVVPVAILQSTSLMVVGSFCWSQLRRIRGRKTRTSRHREGVVQQLAGDHAAAVDAYRKLVWADGWDVAAWIGLGDAWRRKGDRSRAARCYRRAKAADVGGGFPDLLSQRVRLLAREGRRRGAVSPGAGPAIQSPESLDRKSGNKARSAG